ncbi:hypothetical protein IU444_29005 [Nocardia farcinica]|uniref:hypothetical protein n=1 Tax=Nocardia farcinica TaxID=37329 RepID=UPI0018937B13|nr:hypothetical protein [Nocardia farcinica]MBF6388171.1 hypothetical protein [Nocardia farcinica]UEX26327.1 hypothetical protein LMJ57_31130 [Nocardia farcinica]
MTDVTTSQDANGHPVVIARSRLAEGRIHVHPDGTISLSSDFAHPIPTTVLPLLLMALDKVWVMAPKPVIAETATFTARIVTDDSVEPDDGPRQRADIVITADGHVGPPVIATYTLYTNPLSPIGEDPAEVLERHGWRMAGQGQLDTDSYLVVPVERIQPS